MSPVEAVEDLHLGSMLSQAGNLDEDVNYMLSKHSDVYGKLGNRLLIIVLYKN